MTTTTITLTDLPSGEVNVMCDFGEDGLKKGEELSPAQNIALAVLALIRNLEEGEPC